MFLAPRAAFAENWHVARAAMAGGFDPKGHVKMAVSHLHQAIKAAKRTHEARRLAVGIHHAERTLIHLKVAANE